MKYLYYGNDPIEFGRYGTITKGDIVDFVAPNFIQLPEPSPGFKAVGTPYQITVDDYGFVLHVTHNSGPAQLTLPPGVTISGGFYIEINDDSAGVEWPALILPNSQQIIATGRVPITAKTIVRGGNVGNLGITISAPAAYAVSVVPGDVVLLTTQTNAAENGAWIVPATPTPVASCTRAPLPDLNTRMNGLAVKVLHGFGTDNDVWLLAPNGVIVPGTTPLTFRLVIQGDTGAAVLYTARPKVALIYDGQDWAIVQVG